MNGGHIIKHWSRTQPNIALSSGEAELYSAVKGASAGLGVVSLLGDMGEERRPVRLHIDASATKGALTRRGTGRMKHIETQYLWAQQVAQQKKVECTKIPRLENVSDILTHHWSPSEGIRFFRRLGV